MACCRATNFQTVGVLEFNLKKILLALLHSTADSLSVKDIQTVITRYHAQAEEELAAIAQEQTDTTTDAEKSPPQSDKTQSVMRDLIAQVPSLLTATQIRDAIEAIGADLNERKEPLRIVEGPNGWRLAVAPEYADWIRLLRGQPKPQRLSPAALETLAVIAYRQPVTRSELEAVRGVSCDTAITKLLDLELILVTGRADLPGRPIQYGTTQKFLEFCGLRSLEELPASDVLSPNELTEWIRRATQPQNPVTDKDVGLAQEEMPISDTPEQQER